MPWRTETRPSGPLTALVGSAFLSFVKADGLPAYSYVELFNDHPGSSQNIGENDSETGAIVNALMGNASVPDSPDQVSPDG